MHIKQFLSLSSEIRKHCSRKRIPHIQRTELRFKNLKKESEINKVKSLKTQENVQEFE